MSLSMTASSMMGAKVAAPQRAAAARRAAAPVCASLRSDAARFAKAAGVSAASLALALSAQAASVKLGTDGGGLVRLAYQIIIQSQNHLHLGTAAIRGQEAAELSEKSS